MALARIWLIRNTHDGQGIAHDNGVLVLAESAGHSHVSRKEWTGLTGEFRSFPLGVRKIGQIAATGESTLLTDIDSNPNWLAHPEWAQREAIRAFAGHPLVFRGTILGALGVFARQTIGADEFRYLRVFADHAAVAIANANAFEEINQLRARLENKKTRISGQKSAPTLAGSSVSVRLCKLSRRKRNS